MMFLGKQLNLAWKYYVNVLVVHYDTDRELCSHLSSRLDLMELAQNIKSDENMSSVPQIRYGILFPKYLTTSDAHYLINIKK